MVFSLFRNRRGATVLSFLFEKKNLGRREISATPKGRWVSQILLAVLTVGILSGGIVVSANAEEVTWLGNSTAWSDSANWSSGEGEPGPDDVITVPASPTGGNFPTIDGLVFYCRGLILEDSAWIRVSNDGVLYIENPDDGVDWDSDRDGMSDDCESSYSFLDPYNDPHDEYDPSDPDYDFDGDDVSNIDECKAGTNLEDPDDYPTPVPVAHLAGILALFVVILFASVLVVSRKHSWTHRVVILFLIAVCVLYLGYWQIGTVSGEPVYPPSAPKMFDDTPLDFNTNNSNAYHYIPIAVERTNSGGEILVNGTSIRPWNGGTTYIDGKGKTIDVKADGGTVYLGGMRTSFDVALHGEGNVIATSSYTGYDYDGIYSSVSIGTGSVSCFLGEKLDLYATPDEKFVEWSGDASGSESNTQFQAEAHEMTVDAVFLSPGIDLAGQWTDDDAPVITSSEGVISVSATLRVRNIGQKTTGSGTWFDGLFLSRDEVYDSDTDLVLAVASYTGELVSRNVYMVPLTGTIPDVAPGVYYILGVTDEDDDVSEVNNNNNTVATEIVVLDANLAQ